jgi:hypothetical protein
MWGEREYKSSIEMLGFFFILGKCLDKKRGEELTTKITKGTK